MLPQTRRPLPDRAGLLAVLPLLLAGPLLAQEAPPSFRVLIVQGDRLRAGGNPRAASAKYGAAVDAAQTDQERAEGLVRHAQVLRELGRETLAEEQLRRAVALETDSPYRRSAVPQLATLLEDGGRLDEAVALYTDLAAKASDDPAVAADAMLAAARLLCEADRFEEAKALLEALPRASLSPAQRTEALTLLSETLLRLGDLKGARQAITGQDLPPGDVAHLHSRLAQAFMDEGQDEEALQACETALQADPRNNGAWRVRYQLAVKQGRAEELEQEALRQLEAEPGSEALLQRVASMADWGEQPARGLAIYRRLVQLKPGNPMLLERAGGLALEAGQPEDALRYYQEALRLQPGDTSLSYVMGDVLAKLGKVPEAVESWKEGVAYQEGDPQSAARLGQVLAEHSLYQEALALYTAARERSGDPGLLAAETARALAALARPKEALREYVTAAAASLPEAQSVASETMKLAREASLLPDLVAMAGEALQREQVAGPALLLALAAATQGQVDAALAQATAAGLGAEELLTIGETLETHGDRASAGRLYSAVASKPGLSPGLRLETAQRAAEMEQAAGRLSEAVAVLRQALAAPGGPPQLRERASLLLADLALSTGGEAEEPRRLLEALVAGSRLPDVVQKARWRLADCTFASGDLDQAAALYRQLAQEVPEPEVVGLPPPPPPADLSRTRRLAMPFLRLAELPEDDPRMTPAYAASQVAECAFRQGRLDEAKALFSELAEKYPQSIYANDAVERRAFIASHLAQPRPATEAYLKALAQGAGPHWETALAELGQLVTLGEAEPLADDAALLMAGLLESHGRPAEAAEQYRALARNLPQSLLAPEALLNAARLAHGAGDPQQARKDLEQLLQNYPSAPMSQTAALRLEDLTRGM